jgi:hypothetical protein
MAISFANTNTQCPPGAEYPTYVKADYVFACMAANGETPEMLQKCSCSIDVIASILSYEEYERADTVLRIQQDIGQRGIFYREASWAKAAVEKLQSAQAESTLQCF